MKIGLVTPYIYPLPGGVNQHVRYLYENLRLRGHDVRILTQQPRPAARLGGRRHPDRAGLLDARQRLGRDDHASRRASCPRSATSSIDEQFDLLHFHEPFVPFLSLVVLGLSNSVNVATFHAFGGFSPAYQIGSRLMRPSIGRIHGRIAVSAVARHFIERFFPGDYKVIPNGVDVGRFERAVPIARWQDGTKNILFVGRFESRKGLLHLLKAYRILRKTGCECRLLVVGGGPQEKEMRRYLVTRKLGGVEFLGRVSDDERDALFKTADIYCSPATGRESFGIVLLEAMAAGTAIVASDIHGYKGVVRRGREGLLVPAGQARRRSPARSPSSCRDDELRESMARSGLRAGAGVQLGARDGEGRGLLRLRDPAARRPGPAARGLPRRDPAARRGSRPLVAPSGAPLEMATVEV